MWLEHHHILKPSLFKSILSKVVACVKAIGLLYVNHVYTPTLKHLSVIKVFRATFFFLHVLHLLCIASADKVSHSGLFYLMDYK